MPSNHKGPIHGKGWQLWQGDSKVQDPTVSNLYSILQDPISQFWWVRHGHATVHSQQMTDWDATEAAMLALSRPRRRWITKNATENCGVGTTLTLWRCQPNAKCPPMLVSRRNNRTCPEMQWPWSGFHLWGVHGRHQELFARSTNSTRITTGHYVFTPAMAKK